VRGSESEGEGKREKVVFDHRGSSDLNLHASPEMRRLPSDVSPGKPAEEWEEEENQEESDDCRALIVRPACHGQVSMFVTGGTCRELSLSPDSSSVCMRPGRCQSSEDRQCQNRGSVLLPGCIFSGRRWDRKSGGNGDRVIWKEGLRSP